MLSAKLEKALNDQLNFEFESAHIYLAMAAYCASVDLDGFEHYFIVQHQEEQFHATKFYNYINEMGGRTIITGYDNPKNDYDSLEQVLETAIGHEQIVTDRIYKLMDLAQEEKEHMTTSFLKWFVDEQVEELNMFNKLLTKVKMIGDNNYGIMMFDEEQKARVFNPPVEK